MNREAIIIVMGIMLVALVVFVWNYYKQKRLIRQLKELATSLENSKQQILVEQELVQQL